MLFYSIDLLVIPNFIFDTTLHTIFGFEVKTFSFLKGALFTIVKFIVWDMDKWYLLIDIISLMKSERDHGSFVFCDNDLITFFYSN